MRHAPRRPVYVEIERPPAPVTWGALISVVGFILLVIFLWISQAK